MEITLEQRKHKAETLRGREVRVSGGGDFEMRDSAEDGLTHLTGFFTVFEREYSMGFYDETVGGGALDETLSRSPDVQFLVNHAGLPLARTIGGSMQLEARTQGGYVDAGMIPDDPDVQTLRMKANAGLLDQMSFAFSGARSEWDEDYTKRRITYLDIHRGDVSAVNQGANPATSFSMRSLVERLIEPSDEALAELRELFGPDDLQSALATLSRLAPAPEEPAVVALRHNYDYYRALTFLGAR